MVGFQGIADVVGIYECCSNKLLGRPQLVAGSEVGPRVDDPKDPWVVDGPEQPENAKSLPTLLTLEQSLNEGVNHFLTNNTIMQ